MGLNEELGSYRLMTFDFLAEDEQTEVLKTFSSFVLTLCVNIEKLTVMRDFGMHHLLTDHLLYFLNIL